MWQSLKLGFQGVHGLLGQFDPGLIGGRHQGDHGMFAFPGHGAGILDHCVERIQQGAIPDGNQEGDIDRRCNEKTVLEPTVKNIAMPVVMDGFSLT